MRAYYRVTPASYVAGRLHHAGIMHSDKNRMPAYFRTHLFRVQV